MRPVNVLVKFAQFTTQATIGCEHGRYIGGRIGVSWSAFALMGLGTMIPMIGRAGRQWVERLPGYMVVAGVV